MNNKRSQIVSFSIIIVLYAVLEILLKTGNLSSLFSSLLIPVCCYMAAAIGLNLNVGISGELNLGQAGFMSIGAFTGICVSGMLSGVISNGVIRLVTAMIVGMILAGVFGILIGIPTLKLSGDYLAIVTLAFGEIIKSLVTNLYLGMDSHGLHFSFVQNKVSLEPGGKMLLNGAMGATGTERIASFTAGVILVLICLAFVYNLMDSGSGRAIMAARDNRIAASSIGIDVTRTKMLAFVVSAGMAGAAGALYGLSFSTLEPRKFDFNLSIMILVYVVLGGLGNMTGTLIATMLLVTLPQMLRGLSDFRMLIYAIVLIAMMLITNNEKVKIFIEKMRLRRKEKGAGNGEN